MLIHDLPTLVQLSIHLLDSCSSFSFIFFMILLHFPTLSLSPCFFHICFCLHAFHRLSCLPHCPPGHSSPCHGNIFHQTCYTGSSEHTDMSRMYNANDDLSRSSAVLSCAADAASANSSTSYFADIVGGSSSLVDVSAGSTGPTSSTEVSRSSGEAIAFSYSIVAS